MVSPSAAQATNPTLSYADRAKKAQTTKPSITTSSTQSNASKPPQPTLPSVEIIPSLTRPKSPLPGPNDNVQPITSSSNLTSGPLLPAQKPVVNVWNLRAQAQAQSRAQSQSQSKSLPQPQPSTSSSSISNSPVPPTSQHPGDDTSTKNVTRDDNKARLATSNSTVSNGVTAPISPTDDPFVVRPERAVSISASNSASIPPPNPALRKKPTVAPLAPPPPDDVESWPEVGKSANASLAPSTLPTPGGSGSEKEEGSVNGSTMGGKKSTFILSRSQDSGLIGRRVIFQGEKTKWIQIPPQELQATADALSPPRPKHQHGRGHSRQHSTTNNNNNRQNPSQSGSQTNSNNVSASGSRIQSRVQSRSESVQSSPKIGGGRGKRLPSDEVTQSHGVQTGSVHPPPSVGGYYPPPLPPPQQEQPYQYPSHSQPHSRHSSLSQSPLPSSYPHTSGFQTPPYVPGIPMYAQPHPQPGYGYPVGVGGEYSGISVGQPFPAYWSKTERHPQQQVSSYSPSANQPLMFGQVEGPRIPVENTSGEQGRGRQREVVFGSIGVDSPRLGSSPTVGPVEVPSTDDGVGVSGSESVEGEGALEDEGEKVKTFSIGIAPNAPDLLRLRSRTRSMNTRMRAGANGKIEGGLGNNTSGKPGLEVGGEEVKVIDLTDNETRWEFGTTKCPENEAGVQPEAEQHQRPEYVTPQESWAPPNLAYPPSLPNDHLPLSNPVPASRVGLSPITTPPNGLSTDPPNGGSMSRSAVLGSDPSDSADLTVKNFGWGFGDGALTRDQTIVPIARERDHEVSRPREERERERTERGEANQRPRRGSYGGGGYAPLEYRSGYGGRRGRGYGGRGYNSRGYGRGYHQNQQNRQHTQPPFNVTPPTSFQSLPQPQHADAVPVNVNGYYPAVQPPMASYLPGGYETYQPQPMVHVPVVTPGVGTGMPPVPSPVSQLSFPLDPTRYYLLGQLEYYFSPQNLAQDYYLRKQVRFMCLFWRLILNI